MNNEFKQLGLEKRKFILAISLFMEKTASVFLGALLGIKDIDTSRTLGNKSSSLSFNNKIDLLMDIGALKTETKAKFQNFMAIRNQFMHNWDAMTYEKCTENISGLEKFLAKNYPNEISDKEEKLKESIRDLSNEVAALTAGVIEKLKKKFAIDSENRSRVRIQEMFNETLDEIAEKLDEYFQNQITNKKEIKLEKFKNFGSDIKGLIYRILISKLKKDLKVKDN